MEPQAFKTILAEREGEQKVVLAWTQAKPEDRKKSFEKDDFPMPMDMKGKPMTTDFLTMEKTVKIKSILEARLLLVPRHWHEGGNSTRTKRSKKFLK